jgi:hypothetical protein
MVGAEPDQTHQIERARRMTAQTRKLTTVTSEEAKTRQHHAVRQKPVMRIIRWKSPKTGPYQQQTFAPRYGHIQRCGRPRGLQTFTPQWVSLRDSASAAGNKQKICRKKPIQRHICIWSSLRPDLLIMICEQFTSLMRRKIKSKVIKNWLFSIFAGNGFASLFLKARQSRPLPLV